jgi:hypothetical protein
VYTGNGGGAIVTETPTANCALDAIGVLKTAARITALIMAIPIAGRKQRFLVFDKILVIGISHLTLVRTHENCQTPVTSFVSPSTTFVSALHANVWMARATKAPHPAENNLPETETELVLVMHEPESRLSATTCGNSILAGGQIGSGPDRESGLDNEEVLEYQRVDP